MKIVNSEVKKIKYEDAGREFLETFFPIHYAIGMQVEDALRCNGELDRHQTVIMWLLRCKGRDNNGTSLKRKEIERCMTNWYDITSSTVSKALRSLAKPPLEYILITEDPDSGREKLVTVTEAGQRYSERMVENASAFIKLATDRMSAEENAMGVHMFRVISAVFQQLRDEGVIDSLRGESDDAASPRAGRRRKAQAK